MSDKIIVLTKRPGTIKTTYTIKLEKQDLPTKNRKDKKFMDYYETIWKELDQHV